VPIEIASAPIEVLWDSPDDDRRQEADLQARGTELLERARRFVDLPPWRPDGLPEAMHDLTNLAERAVTAMLERMQRECHRLSPQECVQAASLALDLQRLVQDHQHWQAGRRLRAVTQVQDILGRRDVDLSAALSQAAAEACRVLGFDRAMIFRRSGNLLLAEATHFVGQDEWARHCQEHAEAHPIRLSRHQTESEMLRRRAAALVTDPLHDPNTWQPIVQKIRTPGYVATPIAVRGEIVATLHADNEISGRRIGRVERDALAAFGTGLGFAIERAVLVDRLTSQRETMRRMVAATERTVEDFLRAESAWARQPPAAPAVPARPACPVVLTAREREVLELMAGGASNADIAARLVITPGTVKTHVKHVLRKLDATSRAQAVAIFLSGGV
jgi:LuxR family transcriptional regulator, regulator of acetate metabolism